MSTLPPPRIGEGVGQLVVLIVVDQVAALDHEVRAQRPDGGGGPGEHLARQRLLRSEGRLKRRAEAIEERHPGRRGRVEDVGIGDVRQRREHAGRGGTGAELDAVRQRLAWSDAQLAVADRVDPPGAKRRSGSGCRRGGGSAATGEHAGERARADGARERFAQRAAPGDPSRVAHAASPLTTASETDCRATQTTATAPGDAEAGERQRATSSSVALSGSVA